MNEITLAINNRQTLNLCQAGPDNKISVTTLDKAGRQTEDGYNISPEDFVTMLNWYQYQKEAGNHDLEF